VLGWRESSSNPAEAQAETKEAYLLSVQFPDRFIVAVVNFTAFIGRSKWSSGSLQLVGSKISEIPPKRRNNLISLHCNIQNGYLSKIGHGAHTFLVEFLQNYRKSCCVFYNDRLFFLVHVSFLSVE
jgi:hypothetical protein